MINHHRHRDRVDEWAHFLKDIRLEIDHDMPAFGQATSHLEELVLGRVIDPALEEIEAYAANAALMQLRQSVLRDRGIDNGHPENGRAYCRERVGQYV